MEPVTYCSLKTILIVSCFGFLPLENSSAFAKGPDKKRKDSSAVANQSVQMRDYFARSLALLRDNRFSEAASLLETAARLEPNSAGIRCNLGLAYFGMARITDAIKEFDSACLLDPTMEQVFQNRAACYQCLGDIPKAIAAYKTCISLNPLSAKSDELRQIVRELGQVFDLSKLSENKNSEDYFSSLSTRQCWDKSQVPLKVFVAPGKDVVGYKDEFRDFLIEALNEWMGCAKGLSFQIVAVPETADLLCSWSDDPGKSPVACLHSERGVTQFSRKNDGSVRVQIVILTTPSLLSSNVDDSVIKKACLHEVGHALGLDCHSTNTCDIMFYTVDSPLVPAHLSGRDKATMRKLYENY